MSGRIRISEAQAADFTVESGKQQSFLWDSDLPGLGLRATEGSKSFVFQFKLNGRTGRITIGSQGVWKVAAARIEARTLRQYVDRGLDPRDVKQEQVNQATSLALKNAFEQTTLGDAWLAYITANQERWGSHHKRDHASISKRRGIVLQNGGKAAGGPVGSLLDLRLRDVTPKKVEAWIKVEVVSRPRVADKALRLLLAFFRWCSETDGYQELVGDLGAYRRARLQVSRMPAKIDSLQREMLGDFFEEICHLTNDLYRVYYQLMLFTGARPGELLELMWEDVDITWRCISVRDKDDSRGRTIIKRPIPLGLYAIGLLRDLLEKAPRLKDGKLRSAYVFYSRKSGLNRAMASPNSVLGESMKQASLPHLTLHGLRRSYSNFGEWLEWPAGVKAQIMGHKPSAIAERHYIRRPVDLLRKYQEDLERWILHEAGLPY